MICVLAILINLAREFYCFVKRCFHFTSCHIVKGKKKFPKNQWQIILYTYLLLKALTTEPLIQRFTDPPNFYHYPANPPIIYILSYQPANTKLRQNRTPDFTHVLHSTILENVTYNLMQFCINFIF